jgi:hypothetical protein
MYTRIHLVRTFGWDDVSLLVGFVFAVGLAANVMLANNNFYWYANSLSDCLQNQLTDKFFKGIATFGIFPSQRLRVSIHILSPRHALADLFLALGKSAMSAKVLFTVAVTFIRFALLLFYFRLVNDTGLKHFKWALHGTVYFNFTICIVFIFISIFQCR